MSNRVKAVLAAVGIIIVERLSDELIEALSDGLLTKLFEAVLG